jgi:hypothetical protein
MATVTRSPVTNQHDDTQRIGELLGEWFSIRMEEIDVAVAEAEVKAAVIPDQRTLWLLFGEVLVRLHCVEAQLAEHLSKAAKR